MFGARSTRTRTRHRGSSSPCNSLCQRHKALLSEKLYKSSLPPKHDDAMRGLEVWLFHPHPTWQRATFAVNYPLCARSRISRSATLTRTHKHTHEALHELRWGHSIKQAATILCVHARRDDGAQTTSSWLHGFALSSQAHLWCTTGIAIRTQFLPTALHASQDTFGRLCDAFPGLFAPSLLPRIGLDTGRGGFGKPLYGSTRWSARRTHV